MNYKEAFFKLLDRKIENLPLEKEKDAKETINEVFGLLESLEDQGAAKDWVAQTIAEFADDEPFIVRGIQFVRKEAF